MPRKEFLRLMEENVMILDRMADRVHVDPVRLSGYPRQLLAVLIRLHRGGRARLKDIARREGASTPNLCAAFRRLEREGLVVRDVDDDDRRNTWYAVTDAGADVASRAIDAVRVEIGNLFSGLTPDDEGRMLQALKTMNEILRKLELK